MQCSSLLLNREHSGKLSWYELQCSQAVPRHQVLAAFSMGLSWLSNSMLLSTIRKFVCIDISTQVGKLSEEGS